MSKIENKRSGINAEQKLPESLRNLPEKVARAKAKLYQALGLFTIATMILTSCTPEGQALETKPALTQPVENLDTSAEKITTDSGMEIEETATPETSATLELTATPENTPIPSATATKEATATPEKTEAENMHEYCIQKAKAVGIDLENLENSNNLWLTEHQGLEGLEEAFNTSFTDGRIFKTMIVVDVDSLNSQTRYNSAPTTADGKKIMGWMEAIYKKADGQYQLVLLPTHIWDIKNEIMWNKTPSFGGPQYASSINSKHKFNSIINNYSSPNYNPDYDYFASFIGNYAKQGSWIGPGAFISFDSDYPDMTAGGSGTLEEPPFSQEQQLQFQQTGETDFFPYFILDQNSKIKKPIIYPFINYGTLSKTDNYPDQAFVEEFVNWFTGENSQWGTPAGPPYIRHWQALP